MSEVEVPMTYEVHIGDVAGRQMRQASFAAMDQSATERGQSWADKLRKTINSLNQLPHRNQIDLIDGPAFPDLDVRCELFRFRRVVWRILYYIIEPNEDEEAGQVRVIRFRHASARPLTQESETGE